MRPPLVRIGPPPAAMTTSPLSHHEILALVAPFTRLGRHVDLGASNRMERRLAFRAVEHPADSAGTPALHEALQLENPHDGFFVLTRTLSLPGGLQARLEAAGADPGELLAQLQTVPPQQQFHHGPAFVIAHSHRLETVKTAGAAPLRRILTNSEMRVEGFTLKLSVSKVSGIPAEVELAPTSGQASALPEDLLAVLGWPWSRLMPAKDRWRGQLRLSGHDDRRSRDAEHKLVTTGEHLARTLAEPPARFHERQRRARWKVVARRATPLAASLGLIGAATLVPGLQLAQDSVFRMLIFHSPPLLLVGFFCLREVPRIEIPPLPRPITAPAWRQAD